MRVTQGFYVHYKGGIYFVEGTALGEDQPPAFDVIYHSVQSTTEHFSPEDVGRTLSVEFLERITEVHGRSRTMRRRPLREFMDLVDPKTGRLLGPATSCYRPVSRFQRVVGWCQGLPLVINDNRTIEVFRTQFEG